MAYWFFPSPCLSLSLLYLMGSSACNGCEAVGKTTTTKLIKDEWWAPRNSTAASERSLLLFIFIDGLENVKEKRNDDLCAAKSVGVLCFDRRHGLGRTRGSSGWWPGRAWHPVRRLTATNVLFSSLSLFSGFSSFFFEIKRPNRLRIDRHVTLLCFFSSRPTWLIWVATSTSPVSAWASPSARLTPATIRRPSGLREAIRAICPPSIPAPTPSSPKPTPSSSAPISTITRRAVANTLSNGRWNTIQSGWTVSFARHLVIGGGLLIPLTIRRAQFRRIVRYRRLRLLLLSRNGRRVHQLRQERLLARRPRLQKGQRRKEHFVAKLGNFPQSPSQLLHPGRIPFLLQRNPYVFLPRFFICFVFVFSASHSRPRPLEARHVPARFFFFFFFWLVSMEMRQSIAGTHLVFLEWEKDGQESSSSRRKFFS